MGTNLYIAVEAKNGDKWVEVGIPADILERAENRWHAKYRLLLGVFDEYGGLDLSQIPTFMPEPNGAPKSPSASRCYEGYDWGICHATLETMRGWDWHSPFFAKPSVYVEGGVGTPAEIAPDILELMAWMGSLGLRAEYVRVVYWFG